MSPITTQIDIPPGMIDLGIGHPSLTLLPLELMKRAAKHRLEHVDPSYLAYGAEQGEAQFRIALADFISEHYHFSVASDELFITAGASLGLDLICTLFTKPGDTIFVEEPTYFLALRIFSDHGLNVVGIPMDAEGLMVSALEEQLSRYQPVFLYTIPTFQNPTGITLSESRRRHLVHLSLKHQFLIVADEVYHFLSYVDEPPKPMAFFAEFDTVISLGSFSKILAPGLRLGWIQAQRPLLERFTKCGLLDSGGGLNPFTSGLVRSVLELGWQDEYIQFLKAVYGERLAALVGTLRQRLPSCTDFTEPKGGYFVWLALPDGADASGLLSEAQKKNVNYQPGSKFSSRNGLRNCLRLSFSYYETHDLEKGALFLAEVLRKELG